MPPVRVIPLRWGLILSTWSTSIFFQSRFLPQDLLSRSYEAISSRSRTSDIKAPLKLQNTFNDHATRALPEPLNDGASVQARDEHKSLKASITAARDKVEMFKRMLTTAGTPEVLTAVLSDEGP